MTRKEFYLKTVIAMSSNPNYVEVRAEDANESSCSLRIYDILNDAETLNDEVDTAWPNVFDEQESVATHLEPTCMM